SPPRAIVNEAFVRKFFGNENPLGRQFTKLANAPVWTEIAGIVHDTKYNSLRETPPPMIYVPYGRIRDWIPPQGHPGESMFLQVRGHQSVSSLAADLRRAAGQQFTIGEVSRQQQLIDDTLVRERLLASVASLFGGLALLLAAVGLMRNYELCSCPEEARAWASDGAGSRAQSHLRPHTSRFSGYCGPGPRCWDCGRSFQYSFGKSAAFRLGAQ